MAKQPRRKRVTAHKNETVQVNTTGGAVRISQPNSSRNQPSAQEKAAVVVDVLTPRVVEGFAGFLREYAVIGLAIGFIAGQQANAVVKAFVDNIITPLVQVWFGQRLQDKAAVLHHDGKAIDLHWGMFVYTLLQMLIILFVIYALVKITGLDKLKKKEDEAKKNR